MESQPVAEFRRTSTTHHGWVPWTIALVPWLIFTWTVWDGAWWGARAILAVLAIIAAAGAIYGLRPISTEFVVDGSGIRWGVASMSKVAFHEIEEIRIEEPSGRASLVLAAAAAKRICPPGRNVERLDGGFNHQEFLDYMRQHRPGIPIVGDAAGR